MKYVWFSPLNQRKWSVHGACWNVAWEHVRWTQRPHAGYRWFTGSDPDNANATWAFIDSLFSIYTRRGMSFNVHKVASHPLDVKHDTYIFHCLINFCVLYLVCTILFLHCHWNWVWPFSHPGKPTKMFPPFSLFCINLIHQWTVLI